MQRKQKKTQRGEKSNYDDWTVTHSPLAMKVCGRGTQLSNPLVWIISVGMLYYLKPYQNNGNVVKRFLNDSATLAFPLGEIMAVEPLGIFFHHPGLRGCTSCASWQPIRFRFMLFRLACTSPLAILPWTHPPCIIKSTHESLATGLAAFDHIQHY